MISNQIISLVKKNFSNWEAIVMINSTSKFDAVFSVNSPFEECSTGNYDLNYVASIVSIRYRLADFERVMDGLSATVNIFGKFMMLVSPIENELFVLILPQNKHLTEIYQKFIKVTKKVRDLRSSQNVLENLIKA